MDDMFPCFCYFVLKLADLMRFVWYLDITSDLASYDEYLYDSIGWYWEIVDDMLIFNAYYIFDFKLYQLFMGELDTIVTFLYKH